MTGLSDIVSPGCPCKELSTVFFESAQLHNRRVIAAYLLVKPTNEDPASLWMLGIAKCSPGMMDRYKPDAFLRKKGINIARSRAMHQYKEESTEGSNCVLINHSLPISWPKVIQELKADLRKRDLLRRDDTFQPEDLFKINKYRRELLYNLKRFREKAGSILENRVEVPDSVLFNFCELLSHMNSAEQILSEKLEE